MDETSMLREVLMHNSGTCGDLADADLVFSQSASCAGQALPESQCFQSLAVT